METAIKNFVVQKRFLFAAEYLQTREQTSEGSGHAYSGGGSPNVLPQVDGVAPENDREIRYKIKRI